MAQMVTLTPVRGKQPPRDFTLDHANNLFAFQKQNPPTTWKLTDDKFQITSDGKIEPRPDSKTAKSTEK